MAADPSPKIVIVDESPIRAAILQSLLQDGSPDRAFVDDDDLWRRIGGHGPPFCGSVIPYTRAAAINSCNYEQLGLAPAHQSGRSNMQQAAAPKVSFVSLGCPKALVDSERIRSE